MKAAANRLRKGIAGLLMLAVLLAFGMPALAHQTGIPGHVPTDRYAADHHGNPQRATLTGQPSNQDPCADHGGKAGMSCCAAAHCFMSCGGLPGTLPDLLPQPRGSDRVIAHADSFTAISTLPALPPPRPSA